MRKKRTFAYAVVIPMLVLFFTFHTFPLIQGFYYSLTNYRGFGSYQFVGLRNYTDLFTDARVGRSYLFTFQFAVVCTVLVNVLSIIMALGLNAKIRARGAFRAIYFIPNILGGLIIGYIFNFIYTYLLTDFGKTIGSQVLGESILANVNLAWLGIVVCVAWQAIALNTIIYISGLQTIPSDVYEAAAIDGSTGWHRFCKITFPLIAPFFTINMVLCMKNFLMVFDQIISLTKGGPSQSTESISYLIYQNGITGNAFGYQSANAVVYFVVIVAISLLQIRFLNRREEQL